MSAPLRLVGFQPDEARECERGGEDFVVGEFGIVRAVDDAVAGVLAQTGEQGHRERSLEKIARAVCLLGGFEKGLLIDRDGGLAGFDRPGDYDHGGWQIGATLDGEAGFARAIDGDRQHRQAECAERPQVGCGNVAGGGIARDRPARHVNEQAAIGEVGLELLASQRGRGIGRAEHRPGSGFLQIRAQRLVVLRMFLDEPGDAAAMEKALDLERLLEIQAAGDDQRTRLRDVLLVQNLDRGG